MGNSAVPKHQLLCQEGSFKPKIRPPTAKLQPKTGLHLPHRPTGPEELQGGSREWGDGLLPSARAHGSRQHLVVLDRNCSKGCLLGAEEAAPRAPLSSSLTLTC